MPRRTARTTRIFSLEVSLNLVLLNIRKVDFHDFGNYWNVSSSQNGVKTFLFVPVFGNTIFLKARVSVSQIKPMNFPKNDNPKLFFRKWEQSAFFVKMATFVMPFYGFCSSGFVFGGLQRSLVLWAVLARKTSGSELHLRTAGSNAGFTTPWYRDEGQNS